MTVSCSYIFSFVDLTPHPWKRRCMDCDFHGRGGTCRVDWHLATTITQTDAKGASLNSMGGMSFTSKWRATISVLIHVFDWILSPAFTLYPIIFHCSDFYYIGKGCIHIRGAGRNFFRDCRISHFIQREFGINPKSFTFVFSREFGIWLLFSRESGIRPPPSLPHIIRLMWISFSRSTCLWWRFAV